MFSTNIVLESLAESPENISSYKRFCCHRQKITTEASSRAQQYNAEQVKLTLASSTLPMAGAEINYLPSTLLLVGSKGE